MSPLFTALIFGLLAAFFAVIIEIVTSISPLALTHDSANYIGLATTYWLTWKGLVPLVLLASIEECVRFVFLRQFIIHFRASEEALRTSEKVLLGLAFGIGFSSLEVFLILTGSDTTQAYRELLGIILLHTAMTLILSFGLLKSPRYQPWVMVFLLVITIVLHTLYNLGILLFS